MLVHPQFDPVAIQLGPLAVRWYGLMYLHGVRAVHRARPPPRAAADCSPAGDPRDVDDMLFFGVFGVILGGRLGYVLFYKPLYYFAHPLEIFQVWHGGMSFHGGFLGVLIALWFFARRRHKALARRHGFRRAAVPARPRRGTARQFHQRRARRPADRRARGRWSFRRSTTCRGIRRSSTSSGSKACCCSSILWTYSSRQRPSGAVSGLFLIGYGTFRFIVEFAREPDSFLGFLAGGLTMGQWLSLPMIISGGS